MDVSTHPSDLVIKMLKSIRMSLKDEERDWPLNGDRSCGWGTYGLL